MEEKTIELGVKTLPWEKNDVIFVWLQNYENMEKEYLKN